MVQLLKEEQVGDDNKKEYCLIQFDDTDDKKKALERKLGQVNTGIADTKDGIETTTAEIPQLTAAIKALDKEVAEPRREQSLPRDDGLRQCCKRIVGYCQESSQQVLQ